MVNGYFGARARAQTCTNRGREGYVGYVQHALLTVLFIIYLFIYFTGDIIDLNTQSTMTATTD